MRLTLDRSASLGSWNRRSTRESWFSPRMCTASGQSPGDILVDPRVGSDFDLSPPAPGIGTTGRTGLPTAIASFCVGWDDSCNSKESGRQTLILIT